MIKTTSADGTAIATDRTGSGPALVLVAPALATRAAFAPLAELLAPHFTVYAYDRRGRGDSGDTPPYAADREVQDLLAVIGAAGGSANVFGHSSGAVRRCGFDHCSPPVGHRVQTRRVAGASPIGQALPEAGLPAPLSRYGANWLPEPSRPSPPAGSGSLAASNQTEHLQRHASLAGAELDQSPSPPALR